MKISVYDEDHRLKTELESKDEGWAKEAVLLHWDGEYRNGDVIEFTGLKPGSYYMVRVDAVMDEAFVLINKETVVYTVPFYEKKTSYNPLCFVGNRHIISIREAEDWEISAYRDLALNPFDQHEEDGVFPHASANVETRGEAVFAARNAIDGMTAATGHGDWPYESWGINRRADAAFTLNFGRPVDIEEIRLFTRADFPHDSWWKSGSIVFSDGTEETVEMEKRTCTPHSFPIKKQGITWLRLERLIKADDPSPFPALIAIQVYGRNS